MSQIELTEDEFKAIREALYFWWSEGVTDIPDTAWYSLLAKFNIKRKNHQLIYSNEENSNE